ncbi:sensor histidine kinase [Nonomuraea sp. NPDC050556]|uniref:sensor histidine kinase n=1 Tax=Nonomuraea sp. NPDC050556 TaxID=3364369 RepID=UPI0037A9161D
MLRSRSGVPVPPALRAVRLVVLVVALATVPLAQPHLDQGTQGLAVTCALAVSLAGWAIWAQSRGRPRALVAGLAVMGVGSGALAGLSPFSAAIAVGCVVSAAAAVALGSQRSFGIVAGTAASFMVAGLVAEAPTVALLGYPLAYLGMWAFGLTRHAYLLRAVQAEQTLVETRRARQAETEAAALAERARIAREIHDVLAHSLAAVSVNLQAAEGLLAALPDDRPELGKALECIGRAGAFTREGMADARRAILALREDVAPLVDQVTALSGEHQAELDVTGTPLPLAAETGLAAFRAVQEALTNARKHAPGQPVHCRLDYTPDGLTVTVTNPLPTYADGRSALADSGSGYGLAGLSERAALCGGTLTAGPVDDHWRVRLEVPASARMSA